MLSLSGWRRHGLVALSSAIWALACANPPGPPTHPGYPCGFSHDDPVAAAKQLALDCDVTRQATPPSNSAVLMWFATDLVAQMAPPSTSPPHIWNSPDTSSKQQARYTARVCESGSSLSAAPGSQGVYLVRAGLLYWVEPRTEKTTLVPLRASQPGWRLSHVLGFARQSSPLQILAVMVDGRSREALWLFTIDKGVASGAPFQALHLINDPAALAAMFVFPRCAKGYEQCLVTSRTSGLYIARYRGQSRELVKGTEKMRVLDAVWIGPGKVALLVAGDCTR